MGNDCMESGSAGQPGRVYCAGRLARRGLRQPGLPGSTDLAAGPIATERTIDKAIVRPAAAAEGGERNDRGEGQRRTPTTDPECDGPTVPQTPKDVRLGPGNSGGRSAATTSTIPVDGEGDMPTPTSCINAPDPGCTHRSDDRRATLGTNKGTVTVQGGDGTNFDEAKVTITRGFADNRREAVPTMLSNAIPGHDTSREAVEQNWLPPALRWLSRTNALREPRDRLNRQDAVQKNRRMVPWLSVGPANLLPVDDPAPKPRGSVQFETQ